MTKQELVSEMQEGQAWVPGKRVKIDFGGARARSCSTARPARSARTTATADTTIKVGWDDWQQMAAGQLDGMTAFMMGKLKVEGDMSQRDAAAGRAGEAARLSRSNAVATRTQPCRCVRDSCWPHATTRGARAGRSCAIASTRRAAPSDARPDSASLSADPRCDAEPSRSAVVDDGRRMIAAASRWHGIRRAACSTSRWPRPRRRRLGLSRPAQMRMARAELRASADAPHVG